jgi:nicotinic acid mononucleotide adenylyltransferase
MPEAPLIRVLETYDLSSTNVEHFLDSKADLKALVPNSVAGTLEKRSSY